MALPIIIEGLLKRIKVERNRVKFKKGRNPETRYHRLCTFYNDMDNLARGHIWAEVSDEVTTSIYKT